MPDLAELRGKTAVVTGSSSGIGRAVAMRLAAVGVNLLVHSRQNRQGANEVAALVQAHGVQSTVLMADLANAGPSRHAGAITAALYLERFIPEGQAWAHFDVYAWNDADKPGRPRGGEAQGLRACFRFLAERYG